MNSLRSTLISVIAFTLGAVVTFLGVSFAFPNALIPAAQADHGGAGCQTPDEGVISGYQDHNYAFDTSRGTRSRMRVVDSADVHCQFVSSLYVWNGDGGYEFGYLIGYSSCAGHTGQFFHNPKMFWYAFSTQGALVGCGVFENRSVPQETFQQFQTSDTNGNFRWGGHYNGEEMQPQGILMDFNQGINGFGMERGNPGDPGYIRNEELSEWHAGTPGDHWSRWDSLAQGVDHDGKWNLDEINDYTARTVCVVTSC